MFSKKTSLTEVKLVVTQKQEFEYQDGTFLVALFEIFEFL